MHRTTRRRRRSCESGYLLMEAMAAVVLLGILMALTFYIAAGVRNYRLAERAWLETRSAVATRAEAIRAADDAQLPTLIGETAVDLRSADLRCRMTTELRHVPQRPGLMAIRLSAELLNDQGECLRRTELELLKARRQWEVTP
ncbi:MAG: hypothetical protein GXY74_06285 [Phycisphaerae bacterium]|nr:hypothetical protein [Phycisphaerae bacterium]